MSPTFADLGVPSDFCSVLAERGITEPLAIQAACIADGLAGRDIVGQAPTGSGKTLGFGIPLLVDLPRAAPRKPTAMILSPTRELAQQIAEELTPLGRAAGRDIAVVVGGVNETPQRRALDRGVDLLVATPGRLEDLAGRGLVHMSAVERLVVDEADRMADMGFLPVVERILTQVPRDRQLVLFSATVDKALEQLAAHQVNAVRHHVDAAPEETGEVEHLFWSVNREERISTLADVINATGSTIVFTRTRHGADRVARQLGKVGVKAESLHGGRSQGQRRKALDAFTEGRSPALIATDVAARGIHVDNVMCVVHADPAEDAATYTHRSGRTGRAGNDGTVVSLIEPPLMKKARKQLSGLEHDITPTAPNITHLLQRRSTMTIKPATPRPGAKRSADKHEKHSADKHSAGKHSPTKHSAAKHTATKPSAANKPSADKHEKHSPAKHSRAAESTTTPDRGGRRMRGTVRSYDPRRGYGFIERPSGKDLFVHSSNVPTDGLEAGQSVSYAVGDGRRGDEARNVRVEGGAPRTRRPGGPKRSPNGKSGRPKSRPGLRSKQRTRR